MLLAAVTPSAGQHSLTVRGRDAAGAWSDPTTHGILVNFG
jgi:hypothetical protein